MRIMSLHSKRRLSRAEKWLFALPLVLLAVMGGGFWLRGAFTLGLHDIAWAPDGTIWSAYRDTSVSIRDARTGRVTRTLGTPRSANSLSFALSPDGKTVAMQGDVPNQIELRDTRDGRLLSRAAIGYVSHLKFSPDGTVLAAQDLNDSSYFDVPTAKLRTLSNGGSMSEVTPRSRNTAFVALNKDETRLDKIGVRDTRCGAWLQVWKRGGVGVSSLAASSDGKFVAASSSATIYETGAPPDGITLFDARRGRLVRAFAGTGIFWRLTFSPDGTRLAATPDKSSQVRVWEVATGRELFRIEHRAAHPFGGDKTVALVWSPDGKTLATASSDDTLLLWDGLTGQEKPFSP